MAKRKRRRRKQQPKPVSGPNTVYILVAAVVLAGIIFFLADATGVRYGLLGSLLWLAAFFITVAFVMVSGSRFLLPVPGDVGWYEGARLLAYYAVFRLPVGVREIFGPLVGLTDFSDLPEGVPESFKTLGAGVIDSHLVLSLSKQAEFSRAAGPGYVRLNGKERIRHVFDLRPHARSQEVKVLTRDGIPLDTTISVSFQIRQAERFKPDRHAVFLLSYTGSRGEAVDEIPWTERIAPLAAASLVTQLSTMTLDELYTAEDRPAPLEELVANVRRDVYLKLSHIFDYAESDDAGPIEIKGISVGLLRPPDDVLDQRIRNWRMTWESHIYREQASGSAEALRRINLARARAQLDLLQNIVENIDTMRRAGHENLSEVVRLRMLEAMESALRDGQVRAFVPQQVLSTLQDIQEMIDPQGKRE